MVAQANARADGHYGDISMSISCDISHDIDTILRV